MGGMLRTRRHLLGLAAVTTVVAAVSACANPPEAPAPPAEALRHDLEPLTSRWPALAQPASATWAAGVVGVAATPSRIDFPGPSDYWLQAIVTLDPVVAESLRTRTITGPAASAAPNPVPGLHAELAPSLPAGEYRTSRELDAEFVTAEFKTIAYLQVSGSVLVLAAHTS
ncbi:hypothetical protein ACFYTS_03790 [Nocardia sp. NPDC004151]|uniref:hypothetical protein n=1 Tax=Nocardia sp. NPDC004151 TaxID=3364304 RepID=UPI00368C7DD5